MPCVLLLAALFLGVGTVALRANPTGGSVAAGGATIHSAGANTTIHQSTDRAVLHWQGFSIAPGETTTFVQPSTSAAVLNRVTSGDSSQILGNLQANGQVYLLNPNGIYVGPGAVVNAGSFLATTHNTDEDEFMRGGELALTGSSGAGIRNEGTIRATGGDVYLLAKKVENTGTIEATEGTVGLMAGTKFYLQPGANGAPAVRVDPASPGETEREGTGVKNAGTIRAVQVRLEAAGNLYALAVSQKGIVQATGVAMKPDGTVVLAAPGGTVEQAGTVTAVDHGGAGGEIILRAGEVEMDPAGVMTAAGTEGGTVMVAAEGTAWVRGQVSAVGTAGRGGTVMVTAARLGLRQAEVEVSGETGGGTVLLGGDFQGKNIAVRNAERAFVSADSVIRADAVTEGDGGKVITWSDHGTLFYGEVSARGGLGGGDGGLVEVSGRDYLDFQGRVDTRAPQGQAGTLWLDPLNLTISAVGPSGMNSTVSPFAPIAAGATLDWATIDTQLALGNVMVTTVATPDATDNDGTITVQNDISLNSPYNLTLQAAGGIVFGTPTQDTLTLLDRDQIEFTGGGSLILQAADDITFNANLQILDGGNLTAFSSGGNILDLSPPQENPLPPPDEFVFLPGTVTVAGDTYLAGQTITLNHSTHSLQGEIHATAENMSLLNSGAIQFGNVTIAEILTAVVTGGDITQVLGSAVVAPSAFLTANNITLGSLANDFGALGFPQANGNVTLADQNNLQFSTTTITGDLDLILGGSLTQTGVMNVQGNFTLNAGGDILLPLAGIPGNELAWGPGSVVTIERARDVFLGVQNELRLDVATAENSFPSMRNLTLRLRQIEFADDFEITGIASFAGTTDSSSIFLGDVFIAPLPAAALQVKQADLNAITSAGEIRFGAHTYTPGTGAITAITQQGDIVVADGTEIGFATQMLAGTGGLNTEGTFSVETASPLTSANFTVVADSMSFGGTVTVDEGVVTLRPLSPGLTIGFNVDPVLTPVDLDLSTAAGNITQASSLVLGSLTQAGPFIIGSNGIFTEFQVPVTFQTGSGAGEVQLYGELKTTGPYDLTIQGNLSTRAEAMVNAGGDLQISGRVGGGGGSLFGLVLLAGEGISVGGAISGLPYVTAYGQSVNFSGSISDLTTLEVEASGGAVTFGGAVSDLTGVTVKATGGNINFAGAISNLGTLETILTGIGVTSFSGAITDVTSFRADAADGTISLGGVVGGASTTLVATAKTVNVSSAISGIVSLELAATEVIRLNGGTISTTGSQTYDGPIRLGVDTTALSTSAGQIGFQGTVDAVDGEFRSAESLTVTTAGTTVFDRAVGSSTRLGNLTVNGGGSTEINGTDIKVWFNQTFADEVMLGSAATTFAWGRDYLEEVEIYSLNFLESVVGATTQLVLADGNQAVFAGPLSLGSLSPGTVESVEIRDGGTINSAVTFGSSTTRVMIGNASTDVTTFNGGLMISAGGNDIDLAGTIGTGNGNLSLASFQLGDHTILNSGAGNIALGGFVNGGGSGDGFDLTLNNTGTVTLGGRVGYYLTTDPVLTVEAPLNSLSIPSASGITVTGGAVLTTLGQAYGGPVTLEANTSIQNRGAGSIAFQKSVNGSAFTLTLQSATATGNVNFVDPIQLGGLITGAGNYALTMGGGGTIGGATTFANTGVLTLGGAATTTTFTGGLMATAPTAITLAGGTVQTANATMTLGDAGTGVTLTGNTTLSTGSGGLTLGGTVNGLGRNLTLNSTGATTLVGAVGMLAGLASLTTDAGGTTAITGGAVTTSGNQTYGGELTFTGATTLTSTGGGITFGGAVQGNNALTLSTAAGTTLNGGSVATSGTQSYTGAVTLGADTTLTGTTVTLAGTVNGSFGLGVSGNAAFQGDIGNGTSLASLAVTGTSVLGAAVGSVVTSGNQAYSGAVTLSGATEFRTTGTGSVSFGGTLGGGFAATVVSAGSVTFSGLVSDPLNVTAGGTVQVGAVNTAGAVTMQAGGRVTLTGASYSAAAITITAASLANQTGVAAPFVNPGVTILTDRPNNNSPSSLNSGFSDLGYSFQPAPQVNFPGAKGTVVYRFFDAPGVATELQYVETGQTFAYAAAVPVTGFAGPRGYGGEVALGRLEGVVPVQIPGQVLPAPSSAPAGPALTAPALSALPAAESGLGKGQAGLVRPRKGWEEQKGSMVERPVPGIRVSQSLAEE